MRGAAASGGRQQRYASWVDAAHEILQGEVGGAVCVDVHSRTVLQTRTRQLESYSMTSTKVHEAKRNKNVQRYFIVLHDESDLQCADTQVKKHEEVSAYVTFSYKPHTRPRSL